ncbi:hypothetical protein Tco_0835530, partial [Tanacetum coccineum]
MGDKNPILTRGDYSKPSHEGYGNTIKLPVGNNVAPLRSHTIQLVQNKCSFHELRFEDPNQHLKDFLKLVDSLDLHDENRERTRLRLFQFPFAIKLANGLNAFQQDPSPHGRILLPDSLLNSFHREGPVRLTAPPVANSAIRLPTNLGKSLRTSLFTTMRARMHERIRQGGQGPSPQPQELGTTFEDRVRDYMAAHTKRMERFENAIFKQCEVINDRMTEMFGFLKELTTCRTPEKVLIMEEAKILVTKNVNSISLARGEEERSDKMDEALDNTMKPTVIETEIPVKEAERNTETKNKPVKRLKRKKWRKYSVLGLSLLLYREVEKLVKKAAKPT